MQRRRARIPRPVVTHGAALHSNLGNAQRASLRLLVGTGDEGEGLSLLVHTLVAISSYDYEAAGRRPAGAAGPPQPGPLVEQLDDPHDLGHVDQGLALLAEVASRRARRSWTMSPGFLELDRRVPRRQPRVSGDVVCYESLALKDSVLDERDQQI
jgi:hypothetical protein